jgi:hypothetical protein
MKYAVIIGAGIEREILALDKKLEQPHIVPAPSVSKG